jgi:HicA toxin of bacterial toxin-antitoxin,
MSSSDSVTFGRDHLAYGTSHPPAYSRMAKVQSDANISFDELRRLLRRLGFEERTRGSHHIFRRLGIEEKLNLQRDDGKAKVYQVRQVRAVILKYRLGGQA